MKKNESTAVKTDSEIKAGTVILLKTVLEPEAKPEAAKTEKAAAPKSEAKPEAAKTEKAVPKPEAKPAAAKAEKAATKLEAKPEPPKAEKSAAPKPEAKPEPPKAEKSAAPKPEAKSEPPKAEKAVVPKPEAKPEAAKTEKAAAPKPEAKPEPPKAEKAVRKPEVKPEPPKAEKVVPKPEAKPAAIIAEKPATKPEAKSAAILAEKSAPRPEASTEMKPSVPNPPAVTEKAPASVVESPLKRMKQEFTERTNVIKQEMRNIQNSFLVIGFQLHWIKSNNMYKVLNYKNIMDYAEKEFHIKKSTCCNLINIIENFAERDGNGEVIESIADCYRNFSSSQLLAMIGMPEEMLQQVTPDMSVRAIQRLRKGEPEIPVVDAPKAVISEVKPAAPSPSPSPVPVTKPATSAIPAEKAAVPKPIPMPAPASGNVYKAAEPARPAAGSNGNPKENQEKHMPRTLLEIGSYSGYKSMVDKIDRLVKDAFSTGKQMKVKIVCEEG